MWMDSSPENQTCNSCAKTQLVQQMGWTETRKSTGRKREWGRMAEPGFNLIRRAWEEATFSWLPKGKQQQRLRASCCKEPVMHTAALRPDVRSHPGNHGCGGHS